ncbi:MAG: 16S rRNA (cytidine(1402)-2'-O)-methyltransferase [Gemmatimonadota bacterium]
MESGLYVVSTPIGNLGDVSTRAAETLRRAAVVYAEDTRRAGKLLAHVGAEVPVRSLHAHNEARRSAELLERLESGDACVLVSDAGTPVVSDPGRRVVAAALEAGHPVFSVPGPSAVLAALAVSGLPADRFLFLGFAPRAGHARESWLAEVVGSRRTVVLFESPRRLGRLLQELAERGLKDRGAVVARELTKLHEEVARGTVAELWERFGQGEVRGEVTVVVEGAGKPPAANPETLRAAAGAASSLASAGRTTREIATALQAEFGLPRNEAYQVGLRAVKEADG